MELYEANRILRTVKAAIAADGYKLPSSAETDGLMMLLGKLDAEKYLSPKIKHARAQDQSSPAFDRAYKYVAFFRALQMSQTDFPDPVTAMSVMLLHKALFGDFDRNAGKLRADDISTDGNAHTDPKYISGSLKSIIAKMNEIGSAPTTSREDFAGYLSHYMRELLILHPFERGSEFTVRIFMMLFCKIKGFTLVFSRVPISSIAAAENAAFTQDDATPLYRLFAECLSYDRKTETVKHVAPRTRREIAKDLCRPPRPVQPSAPAPDRAQNPAKKSGGLSDDEVLKRAIRLQQKISKLNEQLTELIQPLENKNDG
ncbi:MAG: Fic family protein [Clostridiales bacterium]|nr:Fic family protein [Clostridiales bacterium]